MKHAEAQMKFSGLALAVSLAGAAVGAPAAALASPGILGDTIQAQYFFPTLDDVYDAAQIGTVNPIAEFDFSDTYVSALLTGNTITLSFTEVGYTPGDFNGPTFEDLSAPDFVGTHLISSTNPMFDGSRVLGSNSDIEFNLQSLNFSEGDTIVVGFDGVAGAAPEPGVWALMLGGIGLLRGMLRVGQARRREDELSGTAV